MCAQAFDPCYGCGLFSCDISLAQPACMCELPWIGTHCEIFDYAEITDPIITGDMATGLAVCNYTWTSNSSGDASTASWTFVSPTGTVRTYNTLVAQPEWFVPGDLVSCTINPITVHGITAPSKTAPQRFIPGIRVYYNSFYPDFYGTYSNNDDQIIYLSTSKTDYDHALLRCSSMDAFPIEISNGETNDLVKGVFSKNSISESVYIGLHYNNTLNGWYWPSGQEMSFRPNDIYPANGSCVVFNPDGTWSASDCATSRRSICFKTNMAKNTWMRALWVSEEQVTASDAASRCTSLEGSLSIIKTQGKQDLFSTMSLNSGPFRTGMTQTDGSLTLADGSEPWDTFWSNGEPVDTCVLASSSWYTDVCTNPYQYACDMNLLEVQPRIDRFALSPSLNLPQNTLDSLSLQFSADFDYSKDPTARLETYNWNAIPIEITDLLPGASYRFRILSNSTFPGTISPWIKHKLYCDCELDPILDGMPRNFAVHQRKDKNVFEWDDSSACDTFYSISKGSSVFVTIPNQDGLACPSPDFAHKAYGEAEDDLSSVPVGTVIKYCVQAKSYDFTRKISYASPPSCLFKAVEFIGTLIGRVTSKNYSPVREVEIFWWAIAHPQINGTVITDTEGSFSILFQSEVLTEPLQWIALSPSKTTANVSHVFEIDDCNAETCFTSDGHGLLFGRAQVGHLVTKQIGIIDNTTFALSGTILFGGSQDYTTNGRPCPVVDAIVCATVILADGSYSDRSCINTTEDGSYTLTVPILMDVLLEAYYTVEQKNHTMISKYCPNGTVSNGSCTLYIDSDKAELDFSVQSLAALTYEVYGGLCRYTLGNAHVLITARDDPLRCQYQRHVYTSGSPDETQASISNFVLVPPMNYKVELMDFAQGGRDVSDGQISDALVYLKSLYPLGDNREQYAFMKTIDEVTIQWEYHSNPNLTFTRVGAEPLCNTQFVAKGYPDLVMADVTIRAWEEYKNPQGVLRTCGVSGPITYWDGLIDRETADKCDGCYVDCLFTAKGCTIPLNTSDGLIDSESFSEATFYTIPGIPNRISPYSRSVRARIEREARIPFDVTEEVIVTGDAIFGNLFSDEVPLSMPSVVLYDPPGDMSYAYIEKGTYVSTSFTLDVSSAAGGGGEFELLIGASPDQKVCFGVGAATCTPVIKGDILAGGYVNAEGSSGSSKTAGFTNTFTTTSRITTSQTPGLPPPWGDVVVVSALSLRKARTITISLNRNVTCSVLTKEKFKWLPEVNGYGVRTIWDIKKRDIPGIQHSLEVQLANPPTTVDQATWIQYNNTIEQLKVGLVKWNEILEYHANSYKIDTFSAAARLGDQNKANCVPTNTELVNEYCNSASYEMVFDTLFFTGGGQTYELSTSMENSLVNGGSSFRNFNSQTGVHVAGELGLMGIFKVQTEMKAFGTYTEDTSKTYEKGKATSTTVGFLLGDANLGDKYNVEIWVNKDFGTPMFRLLNGVSSCPYQEGTVQREVIKLELSPPVLQNIPPKEAAVFDFFMQSKSETNEGSTYVVRFEESTNPGGLSLYLGGLPLYPREIDIDFGDPTRLTLTAFRGPIDYDYHDITITAVSACEDGLDVLYRDPISDSVSVTVNYLRPCAAMEWVGEFSKDKRNYFLINSSPLEEALRDKLPVSVRNPEFPNLKWADNPNWKYVVVEYRHISKDFSAGVVDKEFNVAFLHEDEFGFGNAVLDASTWTLEGLYEVRVRSSCNAVGGVNNPELLGSSTPTRIGRVDRTPPQPFGTFAKPSVGCSGNGVYELGDEISLDFNEDLDCEILTYKFEVAFTTPDKSYDQNYLDILCRRNKVSFQFNRKLNFDDIIGKTVTMFVSNVRDLAQNYNPDIFEWSFTVSATVRPSQVKIQIQDFKLEGMSLAKYLKLKAAANVKRVVSADNTTTGNSTADFLLFSDYFCADIAQILSVNSSRCNVDSYREELTGMFVTYSLGPGTPTAAQLFSTFETVMADPKFTGFLAYLSNSSMAAVAVITAKPPPAPAPPGSPQPTPPALPENSSLISSGAEITYLYWDEMVRTYGSQGYATTIGISFLIGFILSNALFFYLFGDGVKHFVKRLAKKVVDSNNMEMEVVPKQAEVQQV